jgi:hypothetical protein
MESRRRAREPELTVGDRLVTGLFGGILGLFTMSLIWFIVLNIGGRGGVDVSMPFYWTWIGAGITAAVGFALGPERLMDGFGAVWNVIGWVFLPRQR